MHSTSEPNEGQKSTATALEESKAKGDLPSNDSQKNSQKTATRTFICFFNGIPINLLR